MREKVLKIITYPHPTLRHESKPVKRVDADLRKMISRMFELMYEAKGIGLAANQVDLPLRLFVVNLAANAGEGEELVFINPVLSRPRGSEESEEGCLSLPGVYGDVVRPKQVRVNAFLLDGTELNADLDGMMARVVQHETDHLDGVLFTDRLSETGRMDVDDALHEFTLEFQSRRETGDIGSEEEIAQRLAEMEQKYC